MDFGECVVQLLIGIPTRIVFHKQYERVCQDLSYSALPFGSSACAMTRGTIRLFSLSVPYVPPYMDNVSRGSMIVNFLFEPK